MKFAARQLGLLGVRVSDEGGKNRRRCCVSRSDKRVLVIELSSGRKICTIY